MTARGTAVAVVGCCLLLAGRLVGSDTLLALGAAALALVVLALGWVLRRPRLEVTRAIHPDRVMRGEAAAGELTIVNRSRFGRVSVVAVEHCGPATEVVDLPGLAAGRARTVGYRLPTSVRGRFEVGPLDLTREDPYGLARWVQRRGSIVDFWVHPHHEPIRAFPAGWTRSLDGRDADHLPHGSVAFQTLREYVIGDDLRRVHWVSSARRNQLMIREMVDTTVPVITVLVDTRREVHSPDSFEEALSAAAALASGAELERTALEVRTTAGDGIGGHRGRRGVPALDLLAEARLSDDLDLSAALRSLSRNSRSDTLVFITGAPTAENLAGLAGLRRRFATVAVVAVNGGVPVPTPVADLLTLGVADAADFAERWQLQAVR